MAGLAKAQGLLIGGLSGSGVHQMSSRSLEHAQQLADGQPLERQQIPCGPLASRMSLSVTSEAPTSPRPALPKSLQPAHERSTNASRQSVTRTPAYRASESALSGSNRAALGRRPLEPHIEAWAGVHLRDGLLVVGWEITGQNENPRMLMVSPDGHEWHARQLRGEAGDEYFDGAELFGHHGVIVVGGGVDLRLSGARDRLASVPRLPWMGC